MHELIGNYSLAKYIAEDAPNERYKSKMQMGGLWVGVFGLVVIWVYFIIT